MKQDMIFFGESGLTSTSANYIANLCKEYCTNIERLLNSVSFINEEVSLINDVGSKLLEEGVDKEFLNDVPKHLEIVIQAKSLIAWLREAIKAKSRLSKEIIDTTLAEWAESLKIEVPVMPVKEESLDEDTYLSNLTVKERNRYYELETLCAVIGKYIHPDGYFSNARKNLNNKILHPHSVDGNGRDTLIYTYIPSVDANDVEDVFFELQKKHREAQAELNGIKYKMETAINIDATNKQAKYAEELDGYRTSMAKLHAEFTLWKQTASKDIQNLKIIIPNSLTDIYNKVSALGKDK